MQFRIVHNPVLNVVIACFVIAAAIGVGYVLARRNIKVDPILLQNPLVELSYSGGWLSDPKDAVAYYRIYATGDVYKATRGGNIFLLTRLDRDTINGIRDEVDDPATLESFVKKDRTFCISAVDGIDTEISLVTSSGEMFRYSDCDYEFVWEEGLLKTVQSIVRQYKE